MVGQFQEVRDSLHAVGFSSQVCNLGSVKQTLKLNFEIIMFGEQVNEKVMEVENRDNNMSAKIGMLLKLHTLQNCT